MNKPRYGPIRYVRYLLQNGKNIIIQEPKITSIHDHDVVVGRKPGYPSTIIVLSVELIKRKTELRENLKYGTLVVPK